jgi:hypothetical protein
MAWQEVPEQQRTKFVKLKDVFSVVGDRFLGVYVSSAENANGYGTDYVFNTDQGDLTLTTKGALKGQLDKAIRDGGGLIAIQFSGHREVGKESPMRTFKVMQDKDFKGPLPKNGPNLARALAGRQAPDGDIPF